MHFPDMVPFAQQYGLSESDLCAARAAFLDAAGRFGIPIEYVDLISESPIRPVRRMSLCVPLIRETAPIEDE